MITADKLKLLTTLTPTALTQFLQSSGYKQDRVTECKFLGITNGGQFCYKIDYDNFGEKEYRKAFLSYNPSVDQVIADIS
jgi:hypothetical protein